MYSQSPSGMQPQQQPYPQQQPPPQLRVPQGLVMENPTNYHSPSNNNNNNNNMNANSGPRAKCDQVVFEAIAKAAEIVVGSRCWIAPTTPAGRFQPPMPQPMAGNHTMQQQQQQPFQQQQQQQQPNSNVNTSLSRFNLNVPEVQGVRTILLRWKRALHVPLRLDVYYQHPDSRRELLERWCLEYAPKQQQQQLYHPQQQQPGNDSSIVQLRHVCKQIVLWLRSLYCWSRMLPAQTLRSERLLLQQNQPSNIGFSIYVVSEGNDDVSPLLQPGSGGGFLSQAQPHSVSTPYGELGWKVFYVPAPRVQALLIPQPAYHHQYQQQNQQQQQQSGQQQSGQQTQQRLQHQHSMPTVPTTTTPTEAQSAPTRQGRLYQRSNSDMTGLQGGAPLPTQPGMSRRHSLLPPQPAASSSYRPPSTILMQQQQQQQQRLQGNSQALSPSRLHDQTDSPSNKPPSKSLSALSLAMMQSDETAGQISPTTTSHAVAAATKNDENPAAAEKRRAALHEAPPQLATTPVLPPTTTTSSPSPTTGTKARTTSIGEYGYGYNNQLPKNIPPAAATNPNPISVGAGGALDHQQQQNDLSISPSQLATTPLSSTPPSYLFGGAGGPTSPAALTTTMMQQLIPPRTLAPPVGSAGSNQQPSVTPPFTRPMGFLPGKQLEGDQATLETATVAKTEEHHPSSLDRLQSSPFQQPMAFHQPLPTPTNLMTSASGDTPTNEDFSSLQPRYSYEDHPTSLVLDGEEEGEGGALVVEDMPFAVDSSANNPSLLVLTSATSSMLPQPSHRRLALFDSVAAANNNKKMTASTSDLDALAAQLAEFKTFGASLMLDHTGTNSSMVKPAGSNDSQGSATAIPQPS